MSNAVALCTNPAGSCVMPGESCCPVGTGPSAFTRLPDESLPGIPAWLKTARLACATNAWEQEKGQEGRLGGREKLGEG